MKTAAQEALPALLCKMAKKQNKQWNGMISVGRVLLVLGLLFISFCFFAQGMVANAQGNAFRAACQSNMKQLGLALDQYAQDSDGRLPPLVERSGTQTWRETLYPYVKFVGVYRCPNDVYAAQFADTPSGLPHSYAASRTGWDDAISKSRVIALVDVRGDDGPVWDMTNPFYAASAARKLYLHKPANSLLLKHSSATLNVLFADGHVKRLAPMDTLSPTNLWTRDNAPFAGQNLTNAQAILTHTENE